MEEVVTKSAICLGGCGRAGLNKIWGLSELVLAGSSSKVYQLMRM